MQGRDQGRAPFEGVRVFLVLCIGESTALPGPILSRLIITVEAPAIRPDWARASAGEVQVVEKGVCVCESVFGATAVTRDLLVKIVDKGECKTFVVTYGIVETLSLSLYVMNRRNGYNPFVYWRRASHVSRRMPSDLQAIATTAISLDR